MADPVRMMWTLIPKAASSKGVTLTAFIAPQAPAGASLSILQNWPETVRKTFGCAVSPSCQCSGKTPEGSLELIFSTDTGPAFPAVKAKVQMCALDEKMWGVFFGGAEATRKREVKNASSYLVVSNHGAKAAEHLSKRYATAFDRHARPHVPKMASLALDQEGVVSSDADEFSNSLLDPWSKEPAAPARDKEPPPHSKPVAVLPSANKTDSASSAKDLILSGLASHTAPPPPQPPPPPPPPVAEPETAEQKKIREMKQRFLERIGITSDHEKAEELAEAYVRQAEQPTQSASLPGPMISAASGIDPQMDEAVALLGAMAFHRRVVGEESPLPPPQTSAGQETSPFEINNRFAYLNSHPALLRPLGLVLTIEAEVDPKTIQAATRVRLQVNAAGNDPTEHCGPWTCIAFTQTSTGWNLSAVRAAHSPLTAGGALDTSKGDYCLETRDVDGTAVKYIAAQKTFGDVPKGSPPKLPAVRSAGISFVHCDRKKSFEAMLQRTADLSCATADQTVLNMDDLVRGFIVEVESDARPGQWFPLGKREETFHYGRPNSEELAEYNAGDRHGIVRTTADRVVDRITKLRPELEELHVAEALFRWDGWSLTVPPMLGEQINNLQEVPSLVPWKLKTTFHAKELPRLRFGHAYRFRLRAANLAGDPFDDAATAPSKPAAKEAAFPFLRYDPVPPPIVLLRSPLRNTEDRAGESLSHLVIRTPMRGIAEEAVERCLLPPMTNFGMAEQHGMYATFRPEVLGGVKVVKLERNDPKKNWHLPMWHPEKEPESATPIARNTPGVRYTTEYLPDPMAKRVCVRIEDLVTGETHHLDPIEFYDRIHPWPEARLIRVRLQARRDRASRIAWEWRAGASMLVVGLPPGWTARVLLSSGFDDCDLPLFGLYRDWKNTADSDDPCVARCNEKEHAAVRHKILCGCHPMLSPAQELTLVHAVPKPLRVPALRDVSVLRALGSTSAKIEAGIAFDRKSTGRIDVDAVWSEIVKDHGHPEKTQKATLEPLTIDAPDAVRDFDAQGLSVEPFSAAHQFGDTKCRRVKYTPRAVARFQQYYESTPSGERESAAETEVMIPSSARPPAPAIRSVVPSFSWAQEKESFPLEPWRRFHSKRTSALRIWLDHGWFASGEGEMLGVVLWPTIPLMSADARPPKEIEPYVTRWGGDPIWVANPVTSLPTPNHFPGADRYVVDVLLHEAERNGRGDASSARVSVVAYKPHFDEERQALYCDIEIHPVPSYFGFVRLALVRYQPSSLHGVEISPVMVADFAQLLPDRAVTVRRKPEDRRTLAVEIFGTGSGGGMAERNNQISVDVETRCNALGGEFVWTPDPAVRVTPAPGSRDALWSGTVTVGDTPLDRRLVIREYEVFLVDGKTICDPDGITCNGADTLRQTDLGRRLIYADVLSLE